ncbi:IS110 family transposase [Lacticaseibacillus parahuelsenbergensis]|uniref:IS110 family transposase n=1 Tax=Lacticaseibacillus TaxID=2759736 RepID=UPI001CDAE46D
MGTDMSLFLSAKYLCSWAGLTLTNNESPGELARISKAGAYLKPLLVQVANGLVHPEIKQAIRFSKTGVAIRSQQLRLLDNY